MKPLFCAISDVHIKLSTEDVSIFVLNQVAERARELKVPVIINGDLNDTKALLRSECIKSLIDYFHKYSDITFYINVGNHDLNNKNSEGHSLEFLDLLGNVHVVSQPSILNFDNELFMMIPYQKSNEDFKAAIDLAKKNQVTRLFTHQGFMSAFMGDYVVDDSSVSPDEVKDFEIVIAGHYHMAQRVNGNIQFLGSPYTVNFGESSHDKYIWDFGILDEKIVMKETSTQARRHVQVEVLDKLPRKNKALVMPEGTLLKVLLKGTKEFCTKIKKDKLKEIYGIDNIVIATEITRQTENRISQENAHNPRAVIDQYLLGCETDFDKGDLQAYLLNVASNVFEELNNRVSKDFRIARVEAENFLSFLTFKYEYRTEGLTLIEGIDVDNQVSTGAGKSTFLDAPFYGIFGKTSKNLKADEVVNRQAKKNTLVRTFLESDGGEYQIVRYRKHTEMKNDLYIVTPEGKEIRGKDNIETQKFIEEIIGSSAEVFLKASYFTQFSLIDQFLSASDTDKKRLITEISDTQVYDQIEDCVKENIKEEKESQASIQLEFERTNAKLEQLEKTKADITLAGDQFERDNQLRLNAEITNGANWESNRVARIANVSTQMDTYIQQRRAKIEHTERQIVQEQENDTKAKEQLRFRIDSNVSEINNLTNRNAELESQTNRSYDLEQNRIQSKLETIAKLESVLASQRTNLAVCTQDINRLQHEVSNESVKLNNPDAECSLCHQKISEQHINAHIEKIQSDIMTKKLEGQGIVATIKTIDENLAIKPSMVSQMNELIKEQAQLDGLKRELFQNNSSIQRIVQQNSENEAQIKKEFYSRFEAELEKIKGEENPLQNMEKTIAAEVNPHIQRIENIKLEKNPYVGQIESLNSDTNKASSELCGINQDLESSRHTMEVAAWWREAIHVYIKSFLMDSFVEQINFQTNAYLDRLFNGILKIDISATTEKGKNVKEKISIDIVYGNSTCSYQSLSGGERSRICLAVNLALSDVISNTSGKSFKLLMLDEVFNGLDENGKEQTMNLLKTLEERFDTIFVIDHSTEFKSLFSNNILIKKEKSISQVVLSNIAV